MAKLAKQTGFLNNPWVGVYGVEPDIQYKRPYVDGEFVAFVPMKPFTEKELTQIKYGPLVLKTKGQTERQRRMMDLLGQKWSWQALIAIAPPPKPKKPKTIKRHEPEEPPPKPVYTPPLPDWKGSVEMIPFGRVTLLRYLPSDGMQSIIFNICAGRCPRGILFNVNHDGVDTRLLVNLERYYDKGGLTYQTIHEVARYNPINKVDPLTTPKAVILEILRHYHSVAANYGHTLGP